MEDIRMRLNPIVPAVLAFGVTALLLAPRSAEAFDYKISGPACTSDQQGIVLNVGETGFVGSFGDTINATKVNCPLQDNSLRPFTNVRFITATVWDRSTTSARVEAVACVSTIESNGRFCGPVQTTSGTGWTNLSLRMDPWLAGIAGFPFIQVTLPRWSESVSGQASSFVAGLTVTTL
jgi:hypothetical protein